MRIKNKGSAKTIIVVICFNHRRDLNEFNLHNAYTEKMSLYCFIRQIEFEN